VKAEAGSCKRTWLLLNGGTTGVLNCPELVSKDFCCVYDAICSCARPRKFRTLQLQAFRYGIAMNAMKIVSGQRF
jgi:hypothetical protein